MDDGPSSVQRSSKEFAIKPISSRLLTDRKNFERDSLINDELKTESKNPYEDLTTRSTSVIAWKKHDQ